MNVTHRPTPLASAVAICLGSGATVLLARSPTQRVAIVGVAVGVALVVASGRDGVPSLAGDGALWTIAGTAVIGVSLVWGWTRPDAVGRLVLVPGLLGTVFFGLGVRPLRRRLGRRFVSAGLATHLVGVAFAGLYLARPVRLLAATAAAIAAWDIAEHGIGLGEQLRTDADTWSVELLHSAVTTGYGAVLVVVATLLYENGTSDAPLVTLVLLLASAITLMALLYR